MNSSTNSWRHRSQVDDKVSDLAIEVVLVRKPVDTIDIWVSINDRHTLETCRGLDCRKAESVTDHLGVVVLVERSADDIGSWRKVDNCRSDSRRITTLTASIAGGYGALDGCSIVGATIT